MPPVHQIVVLPATASQATPSGAAAPVRGPWRWSRLLTAPHRLGFFAASLLLLGSALWWLVVLISRTQPQWTLPWALSPSTAHALLMGLSFIPMYFAGFLYTAGPKWLGLPPVAARVMLRPVVLTLLGWAGFVAGAHLSVALAAAGLALVTLAWAELCGRFVALLYASAAADRTHPTVVGVGGLAGVLALGLAALGIGRGDAALVSFAQALGLWGFVVPVFVAVLHRMIPFFTASAIPALDAWRPMWLLWTWLGISLLQLPRTPGSGVWPGLAPLGIAVDTAGAVLLLWLALRWGLVQSLRIRLLAMLHLGFLWFGIALALQALSATLVWLAGPAASLGLAPLHAVTMGFLGSVMLAMVTRVSCGHGGRKLVADRLVWALFWVVQAAVLLRLAGAWWWQQATPLLLAAITLWTVALGAWAVRSIAWYGRPRVDGKPG